ncbi:MAG: hypothetical protein U0804_08620 [Gemmataceae bacterium]
MSPFSNRDSSTTAIVYSMNDREPDAFTQRKCARAASRIPRMTWSSPR